MSIFIQSSKVLSHEGRLNGGNSDRNIAYLKHINFRVYLNLLAKKILFREYLFLQMEIFENFKFINFSPKEKRIRKRLESRDIRLIFLSRSTERQAGHNGRTVAIDWFQKKAELTNVFCTYFFVFIFGKYEFFCILSVYLFSKMLFKRKFCVYIIFLNRPKFAKYVKKYASENFYF